VNQSPELTEIISSWFMAEASGNAEWVDRHVSTAPEARLVGTDSAERLSRRQSGGVPGERSAAYGRSDNGDGGRGGGLRRGLSGLGNSSTNAHLCQIADL
jgi:hypothetical protein